jgi:type VI secretion system protein ImpG
MHPQLLAYYNEEISYMREAGAEFAAAHPKIAKRLGMHGIEVADPYVERLIESFSFMSARMRIRLDAEFPRFTQRLLDVIYPNYTAPTPSISVAQLHPNTKDGDFSKGFLVPKDSAMHARIPAGEQSACEFRTGQDITLWPLEIASAKLAGIPPDIPPLERYLPPGAAIAGSLRLTLKCTGGLTFAQLQGLDELPLYLCGEPRIASHLHELLHTSTLATIVGVPGQMDTGSAHITAQQSTSQAGQGNEAAALAPMGLLPGEGLLPLHWNSFHGHNLLQEYLSAPERFYFFNLKNLAPALSKIEGETAQIIIVLGKNNEALAGQVDTAQFALHCTPIINLFPRRADRVEVNPAHSELHFVPDRSRPMDLEVFRIVGVQGQLARTTKTQTFRPLFESINQDAGNFGRYFSARREERLASSSSAQYGSKSAYIGSEVFLSLVDQQEAPYSEALRYLSIDSLCTNRDLARLVPRDGKNDLVMSDSVPVQSVGLVRAPSHPRAAFAKEEMAWRLIRSLGFNYLPLTDLDEQQGAAALRDMLRLLTSESDARARGEIASLVSSRTRPITQRLPGSGPLVYGRGVHIELTVDEEGFSGVSPYLFGQVLESYLSRHASINMFTKTSLYSVQRGQVVANWPARMGTRSAL